MIIIDDGSTDDTSAIINSFEDNRIFKLQKKNGGAAKARNFGIDSASSEYIAILDSDDIAEPCSCYVVCSNPDYELHYRR